MDKVSNENVENVPSTTWVSHPQTPKDRETTEVSETEQQPNSVQCEKMGEKQVKAPEKETPPLTSEVESLPGAGETPENPFLKKPRLARSPPFARSNSVGNLPSVF